MPRVVCRSRESVARPMLTSAESSWVMNAPTTTTAATRHTCGGTAGIRVLVAVWSGAVKGLADDIAQAPTHHEDGRASRDCTNGVFSAGTHPQRGGRVPLDADSNA